MLHRKINECGREYIELITSKLRNKLTENLIQTIIDYAKNGCEYTQRAEVINKLRRIFAEISIDMLDPDLVIMDEFQRFNSLLTQNDDEQSMLAQKFFDNSRPNTKILLLSATPYKPYSTLEELNTDGCDEHYQDFMRVMDFLYVTKENKDNFKLTWQHYSANLKRTEVTDLSPILSAKKEAEKALYNVMCRTERFNSGIINDAGVTDVAILPEDVVSYAQGQKLIDWCSKSNRLRFGNIPIEYVKSSPYLLSFMDKYELKKELVNWIRRTNALSECDTSSLLLSRRKINNYHKISPGNGKLNFLHNLIFGDKHQNKTHLLLWIPASNPYYKTGGVFDSESARNFSKIILFSSWEMVPRMISVMISYYSELYTLGEIKKDIPELRYVSQKKNRYGENRLRNDNLLEYPCQTLASLYSPKEYYGEKISNIKRAIRDKIANLLENNEQISRLTKKSRGSAKSILSIMMLLDVMLG